MYCRHFLHAAHCRFWSLLAGAKRHRDQILPDIVDLARAKLICDGNISVPYTMVKHAAVTAVLDVLLSLDFEPRHQGVHIREAELVASHMRIAFSVPKDRGYIRSGYPSEPLLAEAAARQMHEFQKHTSEPNLMARLLKSEFESGLLDQGQRDEVVIRQLVWEAYRRAVLNDDPRDSQPNFSKGCKFTTFIEQLFSEEYANLILNSVPDNLKRTTTFAEAFKDATVRFTHFVRMADDTGTTTHVMWVAFVRCMAIICWTSQKTVDIVIPVLIKRTSMIEESTMTGLLIQVKRRKDKGSVIQYEINQKEIGFFPADNADNTAACRPYVTLVAEIGVQLPFSPAAITQAKVRDKIRRHTPNPPRTFTIVKTAIHQTLSNLHIPSQPKTIKYPRDTHPRYSIFAYGCSETVYSVISQSDSSTYKFLLGHRDVLDEHPRKTDQSLRAVREMKPFWSAGLECYRWVQDTFLQKYQDSDDDDDAGLFIGQYEDDAMSETDQSTSMQ